MTYEVVESFSAGLDNRKSPLTAPGGTLTRLRNATINPGGEIEKRRAFVRIGTNILAGTFGLASTESTLYAFTRNTTVAPPALGVPGVSMIFAKVPNAAGDLEQADYDTFDGRLYLVCSQPSGSTPALKNPHYYDDSAAGTNMLLTPGSGNGYYVRTFREKIYAVANANTATPSRMSFCAIANPMQWWVSGATDQKGSGYIDLATQDADSEKLTSLEVYYDKLAVFSTEAVQVWAVDPDPAQNAFTQLLRGTGTSAPLSTAQYGTGDVLYLDQSGARSMKARDSSNSAAVSDIGSPVDSIISSITAGKGNTYLNAAIALIEPLFGRFWLVFPDQILVLAYFPGPKITAWSTYDLPFTVSHALACGGRLFFRSGDDLYLYGGVSAHQYENCGVEVRLPYLNGKKPGHNKLFEAVDMTIQGSWEARVSYNFNDEDAEESIGTFSQSTWNGGRAELQGYGSHISLRLYNSDANFASLSNMAIHYQVVDDEA